MQTEVTRTYRRRRAAGLTGIVALACVLVLSCAGIAWGAWTSTGDSASVLNTRTLVGTVHLYDGNQALEYPGAVLKNPLTVSNDGTIDAYARVKVTKAWLDDSGARSDLNTGYIGLDLQTSGQSDWYDGGDGWFYYRKVLAPGQMTSPLFNTVTIDTQAGNAYAGCLLRVDAQLECIQATAHAAHDLWNQAFDAQTTSGTGQQASSAVFTGPDAGFSFTPSERTIMGPFDNVLPGESYARSFTVENGYSQAVVIGLRARLVAQPGDAAEQARIRDFLQHDVTVRVTLDDGTVFYNGPAWTEGSGTAGLLDTSLGTFASGDARIVHVEVSIAAAAGNEFQGIDASIIGWELFAAGIDEADASSTMSVAGFLPKTGDALSFVPWALAALASAAGLLLLIVRRRKDDSDDDTVAGEVR